MPSVPPGPEASTLDRALSCLRSGGVIVYPTETVYGLGADAFAEPAVERVAALKGRDARQPILVLVADEEMVLQVASRFPPEARRVARLFWPGPLTLVLPARPDISARLTGATQGIGVRISSHPVARSLVAGLGRPLTSTSANPGGAPPAEDIGQARAYFGERVDLYVEGGCCAGVPSTVLDWTEDPPSVVREGAIAAAELRAAGLSLRPGR
jgi:L-threonylcarbamoyladenylate synthase